MDSYLPGTMIADRFEVVSLPKMGGMGIVYFCIDTTNSHPVALKTFRPEFLPDRAARDRFLREGALWIQLGKHQHIVQCLGLVTNDTKLETYLALELVTAQNGYEDASLRALLIPSKPLSTKQTLAFAIQIVRGMKYAVEKIPGFVHRDLKPENILVGADLLPYWQINRVRVTDFGISKFNDNLNRISAEVAHVQTTGIVGTPLYMAPEQWKGEPIGVYTDVYALGCMMYEMLSGEYVVQANNLKDLRKEHCEGHLQKPGEKFPTSIAVIVSKCTKLNFEERYKSWDVLEAELSRAYQDAVKENVPNISNQAKLSKEVSVANGWSYLAIGQSYSTIGKFSEAIKYHEKALEIGSSKKENRIKGYALNGLGNLHRLFGRGKMALRYHEQALKISRNLSDQEMEAIVLGNLGETYSSLGDFENAIKYFEKLSDFSNTTGDQRDKSTALGGLGIAYLKQGYTDKAIHYLEQELEIERELGNRQGESGTLGDLGLAYNTKREPRRAIEYEEQHLKIARETGDRYGEGNALGVLGVSYYLLGDPTQSLKYQKERLEVAQEIGHRHGEEHAMINLGNIYFRLGENSQAASYYKSALTIAREIGDKQQIGENLGNLAILYSQLGEVKEALDYYEQALSIRREIGDMKGLAADLINKGRLLFLQHRPTQALPLVEEAAQLFIKLGYDDHVQNARQLIEQIKDNTPNKKS